MPHPIYGSAPVRIPQPIAQTGMHQLGQVQVPNRLGMQGDEFQISARGRAIGSLLRTWGTLSSLFGQKAPEGLGSLPDLRALRETLQEAQRNLAEVHARNGVLDTLQSSALQQAEALVQQSYGLSGDGARLQVVLEDDMGGALASVSYVYDSQGRMAEQKLHVSVSQFVPDSGPNGVNNHVIQNDRIIAHEMTHAIMGRNMDVRSLPDWFMEGTAEYVAGGAERVQLVLQRYSAEKLAARLEKPWEGDTTQYAASYIAIRYLDQVTSAGGGIKAIMGRLKEGASLDQAISDVSGGRFSDTASFVSHFVNGGGAAFTKTIDLSGRDPGSIKKGSGRSIVADHGTRSRQPLKGFRIEWPSPMEGLKAPTSFPWFGLPTATSISAAYSTCGRLSEVI